MSTKIRVEIDPAKSILKKLKMDPGGEGDLFVATEVAKLSEPYVPFLEGILAKPVIEPGRLIYYPPYAQKWYNEHKGEGLRGPYWDKRMIADRGDELEESTAKFLGGKSK